uniref:ditrans,polycis-polyprenyl diphosphate synthase [(2E,6E)-farnesyldiphosphate specific] n=1 Tax=Parascaris univalens TaxID=6257 RepID=A0A915A6G1_PARUN
MRSEGNGWFDRVPERVWWQTLLIKLMKAGPMPKHIAFIMDGNRRYARSHCYSSILDGHAKGFDQLTKILEWCRELCIKEVTVYAFSIENFNRAEEEVGGLMTLFENKLQRLFGEKSVVNVCIAYTAQDEMKRAFTYISRGIQKGILLRSFEFCVLFCFEFFI